jgi:hypothetical protein
MVIFVAMMAMVFGAFCAIPVRAQKTPQGLLDGDWKNINPKTRGITEIVIDGKKIHPFGACHPTVCDWGKIKAKAFASGVDSNDINRLVAHKYNGFDSVEITISLLPDGTLRVDTFTHFTDASGRADYSEVNYFHLFNSPIAP